MKKFFPLPFIILFFSCGDHVKDAKEIVLDDSIDKVAAKKVASMIENASKPVNPKWEYSNTEDKMTSKITHIATIESNDQLDLKFPYEGGVAAYIKLRKMRNETNVILQISKGQFNSGVDGESIKVRFDNRKPETYSCERAGDGDATVLFINSESRFIAMLKKAKKLLIEAEFFNNGNQIMEFNVSGLEWKN